MKKNTALFWSGGKDSAATLYALQQDPSIALFGLVTTLNESVERISMHGVRKTLLEAQAKAIGLPLYPMLVPAASDNSAYEKALLQTFSQLKAKGVTHIAYGDIFLEDLKAYRETLLAKAGLQGIFPLWEKDTTQAIRDFLQAGFKTILCCIQAETMPEHFLGRIIDADFITDLPNGVDPCGENGEFHTFCFEGPIFSSAIPIHTGEKVFRNYAEGQGFWFIDLY